MVEHEKLLASLAEELGVALKENGLMLVLAESCTGGMVAEVVTSIAGSSAWFDRGFVTYSNEAKIEMLGVSPETLEQFGAVSEEVAKEMALGCLKLGCLESTALKNSHYKIAASITGIAGPDGGSLEKPVGTVCFAWAGTNNLVSTGTRHFDGNREEIRQQAVIFCLTEIIQKTRLIQKARLSI
jgi:nicotinamide-nucleotide amidase